MGMFTLSRFSCVSLERSRTDLLLQWGPPGRNSGVGDRMDKKLQKAKSGGRCRHFGVSVELQWGCPQSGLELQLSWKSKATYPRSCLWWSKANLKLCVIFSVSFSSVQFSCSVTSDSLWPHGLQHTRPPCPSPSPGVHSNSCPLSRWCHPIILCCPLFPLPSIFPRIRVFFQMSQFFTSGGQSIGVSASASVLPMNILPSSESVFPTNILQLLFFPPEPRSQSLSFCLLFKASYIHTCMSLESTLLQGKQDVMIIFSFPSHFPCVYKVPWSNTWLVLVCWI